jgi:hypothetical protein
MNASKEKTTCHFIYLKWKPAEHTKHMQQNASFTVGSKIFGIIAIMYNRSAYIGII